MPKPKKELEKDEQSQTAPVKSKADQVVEDKPVASQPKTNYTVAEIERAEKHLKKLKAPPPKVGIQDEGGVHQLVLKGDEFIGVAAFSEALGTADVDLQNHRFNQVMHALPKTAKAGRTEEANYNAMLAMLHGIAPKDEIESMLAAQMVATHNLSMEFLRRASISPTPQDVELNANRASKFTRTFVSQMEAMSRYRNKGKQKVIVEHVHVHKGGQAIVGTVNQNGDRGEGG